jgi:hypothetical protein
VTPDPEPEDADPAPEVIQPRKRVSAKVKLNAEEQRLLRDYHERLARLEAEAAAIAAAPKPDYEPRSRLNRSYAGDGETEVIPINPMRLSASDGPPPATFDPEGPPAERAKRYVSVWQQGARREGRGRTRWRWRR